MMRDFVNAATTGGGVTAVGGATSGQLIVGILGLVFMVIFGVIGTYLKIKDSRALRKAIEDGDIKEAVRIRSK